MRIEKRVGDKKKSRHIAMAVYKAVCKYFINKDVYFYFHYSRSPMFTKKAFNLTKRDSNFY